MNSNLLKSYIRETYPQYGDKVESVAPLMIKSYIESGATVIETDSGFVAYYIKDNGLHVLDIYTTQEARKSGKAHELCQQIWKDAKDAGCSKIFGYIEPRDTTAAAVEALMVSKWGFKEIESLADKTRVFVKEVK